MSTNDVPGANPVNRDALAMGCWAEARDGSLVLVESTEDKRVVYSIFDTEKKPMVEYRDAMTTADFEETFGRDGPGGTWTWHDKTPFPWDRVVQRGAQDGPRYVSADDQLTAAERVAQSLKLRGQRARAPETRDRVEGIMRAIRDAIEENLDDE